MNLSFVETYALVGPEFILQEFVAEVYFGPSLVIFYA